MKVLYSNKSSSTLSFENINELHEKNIIGYQTTTGLKKFIIKRIHPKAKRDKFILDQLSKKQVIRDDGTNVVGIPLERAHLLNLDFKKDERTDVYIKAGITIVQTEKVSDTPIFFITRESIKVEIPYIHSLQNYCALIKNHDLDFSLAL